MMYITVLTFYLIFVFNRVNGEGDMLVHTDAGPVSGARIGKVKAFLGIPYAEPPTGQLRFAKPLPKEPWSHVYDATNLPPPCVQLNLGKHFFAPDVSSMNEDCLYLNVWVPVAKNKDELKTVMVFIHGGAFLFGGTSMDLYNGANLAEYGDVIVVTINYRVGALGFFSGFSEDAPGSQGLYDQVLALQWVKDNAKHFHGNPDNIVLFGESAGAFSVSMHQVSPLSKKLFKRAILQSGSSVNPLYSSKNELVTQLSQVYANAFGCTNPAEVVDCLRNVPAENFAAVDQELFKKGSVWIAPRIGNDFLPEETIDLFRKGKFKDCEVLMGFNRDEGTLLLTALQPDVLGDFGEKVMGDAFNQTTAYYSIKNLMGDIDPAGDDRIIRSYLGDVNQNRGYLGAVSEALGDSVITCGEIFQAEYQSKRNNPVYFYVFDHRSSISPFAQWMGVPHGDEIQYVFGNPMFGTFTESDKQLSKHIIAMWTAFAKTGNPNVRGNVKWPRYTQQDPKYLLIGQRDRVGTRPDHNRCERWRQRFRSPRSAPDDFFVQQEYIYTF